MEAVPVVQRLAEGFTVTPTPLAVPHEPFTVRVAVQVALVAPPFKPAHVQVVVGLEEVGKTGEAGLEVPAEHKVYVPKEVEPAVYALTAVPHEPLTTRVAIQLGLVPPFDPVHAQVVIVLVAVGKIGEAGLEVPEVHLAPVAKAVEPAVYVLSLIHI